MSRCLSCSQENCGYRKCDCWCHEQENRAPLSSETMWTLQEAIGLVRIISPQLASVGWHAAIGGGVVNTGKSDHDLDLVVIPHNTNHIRINALRDTLKNLGWLLYDDADQKRRRWKHRGITDRKHVDSYRIQNGKRVDVIYPVAT